MRVLNPKNGTQIRLSKKHTSKMSRIVHHADVAEFNQKRRVRDIFERQKEKVGARTIVRMVKVRTLYKHPSN